MLTERKIFVCWSLFYFVSQFDQKNKKTTKTKRKLNHVLNFTVEISRFLKPPYHFNMFFSDTTITAPLSCRYCILQVSWMAKWLTAALVGCRSQGVIFCTQTEVVFPSSCLSCGSITRFLSFWQDPESRLKYLFKVLFAFDNAENV